MLNEIVLECQPVFRRLAICDMFIRSGREHYYSIESKHFKAIQYTVNNEL